MFYPNLLLKVVSIILIVFAVVSAVSLIGSTLVIMQVGEEIMPGFTESAIGSSIASAGVGIGILNVFSFLLPGILGVIGKGFKVCVAIGILNFFAQFISIFIKFGLPVIFGITLTVLYLVGLYQSEAQY